MRQNVDLLCASFCSPWRVRIWRARKQSEIEVVFSCWNIPRHSDPTLLSIMHSVNDVLPLRPLAVSWHGKWLRNQESWVPRGLTSLRQANLGSDMKNILYIWFYFNKDTSVLELFLVVVFKYKRIRPSWPIYWQTKPSLHIMDMPWWKLYLSVEKQSPVNQRVSYFFSVLCRLFFYIHDSSINEDPDRENLTIV